MFSFQNPPNLIIDKIIRWLDADKDILLYISLVCRNWRLAIMPYVFEEYIMHVDYDGPSELPPASLFPWFKNIALTLYFPITNEAVTHSQDLVFNNASRLQLRIFYDFPESNGSQEEIQQWINNRLIFIDHIHRMLPSAGNITFYVDCGRGESSCSNLPYESMFTQLFGSVIQLAKTGLEIGCQYKFSEVNWNAIIDGCVRQQLSNITLCSGRLDGNGCEIVRRNAKTLQTLTFEFPIGNDGLAKIIAEQTTYPNLWKLVIMPDYSYKVEMDPEQDDSAFPTTVVPFPNLQVLKIYRSYLFTNDILFRGNHHSLRYLKWLLPIHAVRYLSSHPVFSSGKYENLERVHLKIEDMRDKESVSQYARVAADIGRYARMLAFTSNSVAENRKIVGRHLTSSFSSGLQDIECLDLDTIYIGFSDILTLVKQMSKLRELKVCEIAEARTLQEMTVSQMVDKYSPLNPKFAVLGINAIYKEALVEVTQCMVMLVILCPALARIVTGKQMLEDTWSDVVEMEEYQDYRERLEQVKILQSF